jgi:hypothetical protein
MTIGAPLVRVPVTEALVERAEGLAWACASPMRSNARRR